jgi:transposase
MSRKPRRVFSQEFKSQIVALIENGKSRAEVIADYDLTPSSVDRWVKQSRTTGSFKHVDNLTPQEREIRELKKQLREKEMEVEILKSAALILGRKNN